MRILQVLDANYQSAEERVHVCHRDSTLLHSIRPFDDACKYFSAWEFTNCALVRVKPRPLVRTTRMGRPTYARLRLRVPPGQHNVVMRGPPRRRGGGAAASGGGGGGGGGEHDATCQCELHARYVHDLSHDAVDTSADAGADAGDPEAVARGGGGGGSVVLHTGAVCDGGARTHEFVLMHEAELVLTVIFDARVDAREPSLRQVELRASSEWCGVLSCMDGQRPCGYALTCRRLNMCKDDVATLLQRVLACGEWLDRVCASLNAVLDLWSLPTWEYGLDHLQDVDSGDHAAALRRLATAERPPDEFLTRTLCEYHTIETTLAEARTLSIPLLQSRLLDELKELASRVSEVRDEAASHAWGARAQQAVKYAVSARARFRTLQGALQGAFKS